MPPRAKNTEKTEKKQETETPETITRSVNRGKVKRGCIRYSAPGIQSLNNESGHYPAVDGFIDLPADHKFEEMVGAVIFEIPSEEPAESE